MLEVGNLCKLNEDFSSVVTHRLGYTCTTWRGPIIMGRMWVEVKSFFWVGGVGGGGGGNTVGFFLFVGMRKWLVGTW